jgi:hypothetical protein
MKSAILFSLFSIISVSTCFSQWRCKCQKLFEEKSEEWKIDSLGYNEIRGSMINPIILPCKFKIKKKTCANDFIFILGKPTKKVEFNDEGYYGMFYILSDDPNYSYDKFFLALYFDNNNRYKSMRIIPPE